MEDFEDIGAMLAARKPDEPIFAIYPRILQNAAQFFTDYFPGDVVYDASANASHNFLQALFAGGIRQFAVLGLTELRTVKSLFPEAPCHFIHPVKSVTAIREAANEYGVTHFTIDHADELAKVIVNSAPSRPTIVVLLATGVSTFDPAGKFGCSPAEVAALMRAAAAEGLSAGLGFHLDAGIPDAATYRRALDGIRDAMSAASLQPELIQIGGDFSLGRNGAHVSLLTDLCRDIRTELSGIQLHHPVRLLWTPGRALAAAGSSLIVKVELRRRNRLYLNDGICGGLGDMHLIHDHPPLRAWRVNGNATLLTSAPDDFAFYGSSGAKFDVLPGPFALPNDIHTGDYIEIGHMGAAGITAHSNIITISSD